MSGFRAGQPVVWDDQSWIVAQVSPHGILTMRPAEDPDAELVVFRGDEADVLEVLCAWFALCDQTATALEPHPVLGPVPICDRCAAKNAAVQS
ncbi:hypothetical protein A5721_23905 [Mycobacterium vulneris]|nr:hypothetical protein A5721_23905 [Mycolicibacterium vulneris]